MRKDSLDSEEPIKEQRTPEERLGDTALALADADAENDDAYEEANRGLRLASFALLATKEFQRLKQAAKAYGSIEFRERISKGMAHAKLSGVRIGRPPLLTFEDGYAAVVNEGSVAAAAVKLGVSEKTLRRTLSRKDIKPDLSVHGSLHRLQDKGD